ncbi:MAG: hypothetical protein LKM37_09565 [Bacteroidales bacterium]|nr:hypothetical protein [Bacteroidales bacterium]
MDSRQIFSRFTSVGKSKGEKVLERIYEGVNFGFYNPENGSRPKGYIIGKLHSLKIAIRMFMKFMRMFPSKSIIYIIHYIINGTVVIFKDKF